MLNTVPVVGLRGTTVMYVNTKLDTKAPGKTVDEWSVFCEMPADAKLEPGKAVHFFPFNGDLCVSVGQDVWVRKHRQPSDPLIRQAVDNWPLLYVDQWSDKLTKFQLPTPNLVNVIPFAELTATRDVQQWHLMTLGSDASISMWSGDDLTVGGPFTNMSYASQKPPTPPAWKQIAYYSGKVCAYDGQDTWDLTPDFGNQNYTIENQVSVPVPITRLTANEVCPIALQADGALYKRSTAATSGSGDHADVFTWSKWIDGNGVQSLGAASPGVSIDLGLLIAILRSRYTDTQLAMYPSINMIDAFAEAHDVFLDGLLSQAQIYATSTDAAKQDAAKAAGTSLMKHASTWAAWLHNTAERGSENVANMSKQLDNVHNQLIIQLADLKTILSGLQKDPESKQEALDHARAAMWGSLAVMLVGRFAEFHTTGSAD